MFIIVGSIIVLVSVFGGFVMEGGSMKVIFQPVEFLIIAGAALGALVISAPKSLLMKIITRILAALKGGSVNKQLYLDLLKLMYEIFQVTRKDGLIALESHIEHPENSKIHDRYVPAHCSWWYCSS
jgi:chemotaxis protein MotA